MITNGALNLIRNKLYGDTVDAEINYLAIGDDNTAVTGAETTLINEIKRVAVSSRAKPSDYNLQTIFDLLDSDGALTIREIGTFAGGTSTPDSGTLISRILYTRDKTSLESIQFNRTDTIGRG